MIIKKIAIKNYRTLEDIELVFNGYYTAISGRNNAGKSNIIRAIRGVLNHNPRFRFLSHSLLGFEAFNWKDEVTSWKKEKNEDIQVNLTLELDKNSDSAIFKFFTSLIFKENENIKLQEKEILQINLCKTFKNETKYTVIFGGNEVKEDYQKQEVLKRLQSTQCLIFHNSTQNESFNPFEDSIDKVSNFIGTNEIDAINKKKSELVKIVQKSLKHHQDELTGLLGNLEDKYEVSLSTQGLNFERETIDISLKEKGADVSLDDWGSGTKNRTLIFLNLLNAKRSQNSSLESDRITPIVLIEEPESFLHPQAQAEFGRILQDLASQLQIQVIITTHSPYLLSFKKPEANILVNRNTKPRSKNISSYLIETNQEKWFEPFALALGINASDFGPLKDIIFSDNSKILLVEGIIDKEYLEYFQKDIHKENSLTSDMEIFAYDGADNLKNNILMNFIKSKFKKVIVTLDIDRYLSIKKSLITIGFKENTNIFAVGKKEPGKESIEGLIPTSTCVKVYANNAETVRKATMSLGKPQKSAKNELKRKLLQELISEDLSKENLKDFYTLVAKLNKALK